MDSDAVFHEESEYVIVFKIRVTNNELSPIFEKNAFYSLQKTQKKSKKYLTCIFIKTGSNWESFTAKMISAKNSINPESFNGFERDRRIDMAKSHGYTPLVLG
jgi:hypothetical protein